MQNNDELIFKREFPKMVGISFEGLRQRCIRYKMQPLKAVHKENDGASGAYKSMFSLNQALEYKRQTQKQRDAAKALQNN